MKKTIDLLEDWQIDLLFLGHKDLADKTEECLDEIQAVKNVIEKIKEGDVEVLPFSNEPILRVKSKHLYSNLEEAYEGGVEAAKLACGKLLAKAKKGGEK
jgi:hypothetical protein